MRAVYGAERRTATPARGGQRQSGDAEANFLPRLVGEPVAIEAFEVEGGKNVPEFGRVWSGMVLDGDRLYFGVDSGAERGAFWA